MLQGNLDKVVQHGKRADAIVKNMLLHSREGSGEHRVVDINALVEESLNLAYHGARAEKQGFNITLERSLDPAAGAADVFPQDITRALLNLILNGFYAATKRKAEANGGDYEPTLTAATKNLGDRVEIRIRDNGTGIPPEVKEKIFNPFFTTKPAGEGTGLGLSISHDIIVKQHGGSIEVETQPGEFTEILRKRVAAIVVNTDAAPFAISATKSIPIVFVIGSVDPVAAGFVPNLNHPGGNVTGVTFSNEGLVSKRLEILHDLVPNAETVALLVNPEYFRAEAELRELNMGGRALRQKFVVFKASNDREIDAAFTAIAQNKVSTMLVGAGAFLTSRRRQIVQLAALHKIPAIYALRQHTEAGGLISYGATITDAYRRAGVYVARILKGEKPGDLPVELPTKFELVINLTTAKTLGLDIPFHLQQRADELIE